MFSAGWIVWSHLLMYGVLEAAGIVTWLEPGVLQCRECFLLRMLSAAECPLAAFV